MTDMNIRGRSPAPCGGPVRRSVQKGLRSLAGSSLSAMALPMGMWERHFIDLEMPVPLFNDKNKCKDAGRSVLA
jgi:hypothetical protein